jgi:hypothetical protein
MSAATLPAWMRHCEADGLVRLGRDRDGGYIVSEADLRASEMLLSMGINEDWSFERDFLKRNPVPMAAYDGSIGSGVFTVRFALSLMLFPVFWRVYLRAAILCRYLLFFRGQRRHIRRFVGSATGGKHLSIDDVFKAVTTDRIFLKCDIEGAEYRILDGILAQRHRLTGLVIEFHDCDLHIDRIEHFCAQLGLPLVHVHANNFAPRDARTGLPLILEMTFSAHAPTGTHPRVYPSPLDRPADPERPEIVLTFADQPSQTDTPR